MWLMVRPDVSELAAVAAELAQTAGEVLRHRPDDLHVESKTTPTDAVTVMDRAAEKVVLDGLRERRPGERVVAEESGDSSRDDPRQSGVVWYVDPLDGTVNYLYRLAPYAVSIAAAVDDVPVAGAVYDVTRDELFVAAAGAGATCNGERLRCTTQTEPALSLVATGFGYDAGFRAAQADVVRQLLPQLRDIRRAGSAALDLCSVAAGRVDAYFEAGMQVWDWAAGALIAREAGARVDGLEGRGPGRRVTLAANPRLFDTLHDMLLAAGAGDLAPPS
jgi:myo-inositol-1(or 4)-monophosphatase